MTPSSPNPAAESLDDDRDQPSPSTPREKAALMSLPASQEGQVGGRIRSRRPSQKETTPRPTPTPLSLSPAGGGSGTAGREEARAPPAAPGCHGNHTPTAQEAERSRRQPRRARPPHPIGLEDRARAGVGAGKAGAAPAAPAQPRAARGLAWVEQRRAGFFRATRSLAQGGGPRRPVGLAGGHASPG